MCEPRYVRVWTCVNPDLCESKHVSVHRTCVSLDMCTWETAANQLYETLGSLLLNFGLLQRLEETLGTPHCVCLGANFASTCATTQNRVYMDICLPAGGCELAVFRWNLVPQGAQEGTWSSYSSAYMCSWARSDIESHASLLGLKVCLGKVAIVPQGPARLCKGLSFATKKCPGVTRVPVG